MVCLGLDFFVFVDIIIKGVFYNVKILDWMDPVRDFFAKGVGL